MINPLDEVLNIVYKDDHKFKKDFIAEQYKIRNNRIKVLNDVKGTKIKTYLFLIKK